MLGTGEPLLPNNPNGFRTTHTCELCGFEPKTKNKYREKQDHMVMKHFKEKIDKIFPAAKPYACPAEGCPFLGKDKQALLRHYTGKHGILEMYLREALAERGVRYVPGESHKRRPPKATESAPPGDRTDGEDPRREVEALLASFQPRMFPGPQCVILPQNAQLLSRPSQPLPASQLPVGQTIAPPASFSVPTSGSGAPNLPRLVLPNFPTEPLPLQILSGHSGGLVTAAPRPQSLVLSNAKITPGTFLENGLDGLADLTPKMEPDADETAGRPTPLPSFTSPHAFPLDASKARRDGYTWTHDPTVDCPDLGFLSQEQEDGVAAFDPDDYAAMLGDVGVQERQLDFYMM